MTSYSLEDIDKKEVFTIPLIIAAVATFTLFFIDEGYYDLRWMLNLGNWIAFIIYTIALLFGQVIANVVILRNYKGNSKIAWSAFIGVPLGVAFLIGLFYLRFHSTGGF